jgi:hypothetical protein
VPLSQALHTEDHALLEQCLELKEAKAIKATVQRLPVQVQPYRALWLLVGKHSCKLVARAVCRTVQAQARRSRARTSGADCACLLHYCMRCSRMPANARSLAARLRLDACRHRLAYHAGGDACAGWDVQAVLPLLKQLVQRLQARYCFALWQ